MITKLKTHPHILGLIGVNAAAYALYKISTGPKKNNMRKTFTIEIGSSALGVLTGSFFETNFTSLLINTAFLSTLGGAHIAAFGVASFWSVFGAGAVGGVIAS